MKAVAAVCAIGAFIMSASECGAQSTLLRTPNLSAAWTGAPGSIDFNFLHRFNQSGPPQRQVQNRPTFLLAYTGPWGAMAGVNYATRSALVADVPNEWEPFLRIRPLTAELPVDLGLQLAYNSAARSLDGEMSAAFTAGPLTPIVAARVLSRDGGERAVAVVAAAGAVLRVHEHAAIGADAGLRRSDGADSRVFWGAGLQLRIPNSPHTVSVQATNTDAATLQASSRASGAVRWGFEFTISLTPARYLSRRSAATATATSDSVVVMHSLQFKPAQLRVRAGTRVQFRNDDPLEHTVTAADTSWDSGLIAPGATWSRQFDRPGKHEIVCKPHPFMKMEVIVE